MGTCEANIFSLHRTLLTKLSDIQRFCKDSENVNKFQVTFWKFILKIIP